MKKAKKTAKDMLVGGMALGVGASVAGGHIGGAMTKISGAMPAIGSVVGAGMVVGSLKHLENAAKPKKKKKMY